MVFRETIKNNQHGAESNAWVVDTEVKCYNVGNEGGRGTGKRDKKAETEKIWETNASTFSSTTTTSVTAITLCKSANTATNIITEDTFVAGIGHGCFNLFLRGI